MTAPEPVPLAFPKNLFFGAKDYSSPQVKVVSHRRQSVAQLRQLHENLGKAINNLAVADAQGFMGYALDVAVGFNQDIAVQLAKVVKANANAEQRYDDRTAAAAEPPADAMAHNAAVLSRLIPGQ